MNRALWIAASGMKAQQLSIEVTSHNLANVNTDGFKKSRAEFQDLFYQMLSGPGAPAGEVGRIPTGIQVGHGVRMVCTNRNFSQGDYQTTSDPLDVLIEGSGFFQIRLPSGEMAYTRAGNFKKDGDGNMVNSEGYFLEPNITIPSNALAINVSSDGKVSATLPDQSAPAELGTIELAQFVNPSGLISMGRNLYRPSSASGEPIVGTPGTGSLGKLVQSYLEKSNVDMVEEMVRMIVGQRAYEINSRAVRTADEMLAQVSNLHR